MAGEKNQEGLTKDKLVKSQTGYKGNSQQDLVEVEIIKDGNHYKAGQKDKVHPTVAAILKTKGLIAMFIMVLFCMGVNAQSAFKYTTANPTGAFTNAALDTMTYTLKKSYKLISIQPVFTRATGTMAGTAILAKSVNGTSWVNTDTLTLTNAATSTPTVWEKVSAAKYWRIIRSGATTVTGTSAATISVAEQ